MQSRAAPSLLLRLTDSHARDYSEIEIGFHFRLSAISTTRFHVTNLIKVRQRTELVEVLSHGVAKSLSRPRPVFANRRVCFSGDDANASTRSGAWSCS